MVFIGCGVFRLNQTHIMKAADPVKSLLLLQDVRTPTDKQSVSQSLAWFVQPANIHCCSGR